MKYLHDYIQEANTELFERLGVIFGFNKEQIQEGLTKIKEKGILLEGEKVAGIGNGTYVPKKNIAQFLKEMEAIRIAGIASDIAENGITDIIMRELANHETQISGDITSTVEALEGYKITEAQIEVAYRSYYAECIKNGWF